MRVFIVVLLLIARTAAAQPAAAGPPSKTLERAIKLYDKKDFLSSSVELQKVLDGETGDDAANKQRAEFFMGKTLYQMSYYTASLAYFDRIVAAGAAHTYYIATLKWLMVILEQPAMSINRGLLSAYDPSAADDPSIDDKTRNAFRYHHGRALVEQSKFAEAERSLRAARGGFESRAALELAKIAFRTQRIDDGVAAIRAAAADPAMSDEAMRVLATWTRLLKTPQQGREALGAFAGIHQLAALEYSRLGLSQPELAGVSNDTFDALAITTSCAGVANPSNGIPELRRNIRDLRAQVEKLLQYDDNAEAYVAVEKVLAHSPLLRLAILDADMRDTRMWVNQLDTELRALVQADKAWQTTQVAATVLQELTVQQAVGQADAGKRYRNRLEIMQRDLAALWQVFDQGPAIPLGPKAGIVVGTRLCTSLLAMPPRELAGPGSAQPIAVAPVRGDGCAGCATGGDAGGVLLVLVIGFARRRRRTAA